MDHAAIQSQVASCLAYAGQQFAFGAATFKGALERVSIEDPGAEVIASGDGFRLTFSTAALATLPSVGSVISTTAARYRVLTHPSVHPSALTAECIIEPIQP